MAIDELVGKHHNGLTLCIFSEHRNIPNHLLPFERDMMDWM